MFVPCRDGHREPHRQDYRCEQTDFIPGIKLVHMTLLVTLSQDLGRAGD